MRLILLGGPGVGKGTQAEMLAAKLKVPHISTGEIFRENIKQGTPLGKEIKEFIDKGLLVPDEVTVKTVEERLRNDDCSGGYILDGFPRSIPQAEALEEALGRMGTEVDVVLSFELPDNVIVKRLSGRRVCPECSRTYHIEYTPPARDGYCDNCNARLVQRSDDEEKTIRERLENYHKTTAPLIDYYAKRNKLRVVDAGGSVKEVFSRVMKALGEE